mmetsp:Transcript_4929/g.10821  ORF Transcript_4929/g.10821 Transcript_4929/m.10821 type:complete len:87 (-) Transcript_4929:300-560(-)
MFSSSSQIISRIPHSTAAIKRTLASLNFPHQSATSGTNQYMLHCAGTVAALASVSAVSAAVLASKDVKRGVLESQNHVFHDHQHFR